jgi:oligopeptide transport system permease protein
MVVFKLPVIFEIKDMKTYIAPMIALTSSSCLTVAYFVKKYVSIELNKDYVKMAQSKGLTQNQILYRHVIRNAFIPFYRTIPYSILMCFCGYYVLEATFNIPGIGQALVYAIELKDINLIRGILMFFIFLSMIAYLIGDLVSVFFKKNTIEIKEDKIYEN